GRVTRARQAQRGEEAKGDPQRRGAGGGRQELPEGDGGDARREEGGRPETHHVSRREDDLDAVASVGTLELLFALRAQDPTDGTPAEHPLPPVVSGPIEDNVARKHPYKAHRQGNPPSEDELIGQHAAGDDRQLFGERNAEARDEEDHEQADVSELLDDRNDQTAPLGQDSISGRW